MLILLLTLASKKFSVNCEDFHYCRKLRNCKGLVSRAYSMHSSIHPWTIHVLNQQWEAAMLEIVGLHIPDMVVRKSLVPQRRLIRHAAICWYLVINRMMEENGIAWVLGSLSNLCSDQSKLGEAKKMYQRALQWYVFVELLLTTFDRSQIMTASLFNPSNVNSY